MSPSYSPTETNDCIAIVESTFENQPESETIFDGWSDCGSSSAYFASIVDPADNRVIMGAVRVEHMQDAACLTRTIDTSGKTGSSVVVELDYCVDGMDDTDVFFVEVSTDGGSSWEVETIYVTVTGGNGCEYGVQGTFGLPEGQSEVVVRIGGGLSDDDRVFITRVKVDVCGRLGGGFNGTSTDTPSCTPGMFGVATSFGDPHEETYDDMEFNCQGMGDFILSKSNSSDFMIQGRFARPFNITKTVSWTRGVAFLEGTHGLPTLEISYPPYSENESSLPCFKNLVVNGALMDPVEGMMWTSDDLLTTITFTTAEDNVIWIFTVTKVEEGLEPLVIEVKDRIPNPKHGWGCTMTLTVSMDLCYRQDEKIFGLFGNNNGEPLDDWSDLEGNWIIRPPSTKQDLPYCMRWCIKDPLDSIFTYGQELAGTFEEISQCTDQSYDVNEDYLDTLDPYFLELCLGEAHNFVNCVLEATIGDPDTYFEDEAAIALSTEFSEFKWTACAANDDNCGTDWGAKNDLHLEGKLHLVVCCASTSVSDALPTYSDWKHVEGSLWSYAQCTGGKMDYRAAESFCASLDAGIQGVEDGLTRVCTIEELPLAAQATSCDFDGEFIWSSTGPSNEVIHEKVVACGRRGNMFCDDILDGRSAKAVVPSSKQLFATVCCSDTDMDGFKNKCDDNLNVWANADMPDVGCLMKATYDQAVHFCSHFSARLCTYDEILDNCAKKAGGKMCTIDEAVVWTSTNAFSMSLPENAN